MLLPLNNTLQVSLDVGPDLLGLGALLVNFSGVVMVSMLPAVAGIGPGQVAMVEFFGAYGSAETLLACSITLAGGSRIFMAFRNSLRLSFNLPSPVTV